MHRITNRRVCALLAALGCVALAVSVPAASTAASSSAGPASVRPRAVGELDCNGLSPGTLGAFASAVRPTPTC